MRGTEAGRGGYIKLLILFCSIFFKNFIKAKYRQKIGYNFFMLMRILKALGTQSNNFNLT